MKEASPENFNAKSAYQKDTKIENSLLYTQSCFPDDFQTLGPDGGCKGVEQGGSDPKQVSLGSGYLGGTSENSGEKVRNRLTSPSSLWETSPEDRTSSSYRGEGHTMSFADFVSEGASRRRIRRSGSFRKRVDMGLATNIDIHPVLFVHRKRKMGEKLLGGGCFTLGAIFFLL